jgi:hypothetical protein
MSLPFRQICVSIFSLLLLSCSAGREDQPATIVCLTFDDAHASVYHQALPILERYGLRASNFVNSALLDGSETMTWDQVISLSKDYGWETGAHGLSHENLAELSYPEARQQINAQLDTNDSEDPELYEYGSFDYGWGLYIYDPSASRPMMITAPHPCDDYPSPVISIEALLAWDARFLLVAGAGREVAYFPPYHSNNQSISDPSRFADHPFNVTYQHAATQLRGLTGRTEFSVQLHTYDWNKYPNKAPVMLSAGNGRLHPTLPVRDHRRAPNDLIHNTPWQVMEANSFGTHDAVDVSQYYSIYRASAYEIYYEQDGISAFIPQNTDLPGASENCQMLFTQQFNLYDSYSPFLHIEMDELPRCFDQSGDQRDLFYGYSEEMGWPLATRYTRFLGFYWPVIEALDLCLDELLMMNDGNAPSNPENFRISGVSASAYVLTWQRSYDYDFDTYEIQTRWHDGVSWQLSESDRNLYEDLAWQPLNEYLLSFPENSTMIYVRMRARDKHGNVSAWTEELKVFRPASGMGSFAQFALQPDNGRIKYPSRPTSPPRWVITSTGARDQGRSLLTPPRRSIPSCSTTSRASMSFGTTPPPTDRSIAISSAPFTRTDQSTGALKSSQPMRLNLSLFTSETSATARPTASKSLSMHSLPMRKTLWTSKNPVRGFQLSGSLPLWQIRRPLWPGTSKLPTIRTAPPNYGPSKSSTP